MGKSVSDSAFENREILMAQRIFGSAQVFASAYSSENGGVGEGFMQLKDIEVEMAIIKRALHLVRDADDPHVGEQLLTDIAKLTVKRLVTLAEKFVSLYHQILGYTKQFDVGHDLPLLTWKKMEAARCVASIRLLSGGKLVHSLDANDVNETIFRVNEVRRTISMIFQDVFDDLQDIKPQHQIVKSAKGFILSLADDVSMQNAASLAGEFLASMQAPAPETSPKENKKKRDKHPRRKSSKKKKKGK